LGEILSTNFGPIHAWAKSYFVLACSHARMSNSPYIYSAILALSYEDVHVVLHVRVEMNNAQIATCGEPYSCVDKINNKNKHELGMSCQIMHFISNICGCTNLSDVRFLGFFKEVERSHRNRRYSSLE
jgi:hypothetical protein